MLEHLRTIVASSGIWDTVKTERFVECINHSAQSYWAWKQLQDENLNGIVREELARAKDATTRLVTCIDQLGGTSRHYLYSMQPDHSATEFHESLNSVAERIYQAFILADNGSSAGGRPVAFARRSFAALVAHAIRRRLGEEPTTKRNGLFEQVLATSLEAIEKREVNSVRDLMRAALKIQVIEHGDNGLIEFRPADE